MGLQKENKWNIWTKHLLCANHCSSCLGHINEQSKDLCFRKTYILEERDNILNRQYSILERYGKKKKQNGMREMETQVTGMDAMALMKQRERQCLGSDNVLFTSSSLHQFCPAVFIYSACFCDMQVSFNKSFKNIIKIAFRGRPLLSLPGVCLQSRF